MAKSSFILPVVLAAAFASTQVLAQASGGPEPAIENAFLGSPQACSQQQSTEEAHTIYIPQRLADRARLKARLLNLLRDSLYDDARGVVDMARENEIKKLANKLKDNSTK